MGTLFRSRYDEIKLDSLRKLCRFFLSGNPADIALYLSADAKHLRGRHKIIDNVGRDSREHIYNLSNDNNISKIINLWQTYIRDPGYRDRHRNDSRNFHNDLHDLNNSREMNESINTETNQFHNEGTHN